MIVKSVREEKARHREHLKEQKQLRVLGSISPSFKDVAEDMLRLTKTQMLWVTAVTERAEAPTRFRARE